MIMNILKRLLLICIFASAVFFADAQVDGEKSRQDTLYIYEEEITYDTLYVSETFSDYTGMSKEDLIEIFLHDRGVGRLYYQKGGMYITGANELYRLNKTDLARLLSATEFEEYRHAKRNQHISIPLFVAGGAAGVIAGIGLYQFCASFVLMANYRDYLLSNDELVLKLWRSQMGSLFLCAGSSIAAVAFIVPAVVLTIKSKTRINHIVNRFNASPTMSMQLRLGYTPTGPGLTLSF